MVSRTIEWHKECLRNSIKYAEQKEKRLKQLSTELEKLSKRNTFYYNQILEANKQNKKTFDNEKFLIKKVRKTQAEVHKR